MLFSHIRKNLSILKLQNAQEINVNAENESVSNNDEMNSWFNNQWTKQNCLPNGYKENSMACFCLPKDCL